MSKLDKEQVIAEFTAAYKTAFGKEPQLEQKPGWFSVDGGKNIRLAELAELAQSYAGSKAAAKPKKAEAKKADKPAVAKAESKPATSPKTAPKAAKKPAAKKAKPVPAASRPLHQQPAAQSWAEQVGTGQRMPRGAR
ncbi:hypothetical protein Q3O60_04140 [Alkalimonas collagenimarina]|uniref:Uncharacterized protein n=1 Tax=Alkalimonas collagenimarina TaxID=400390 RepID=A0ABT9GWG2_9GAMM|nr:hypothetical protein [Alkalimonas collagenimarina]MDP4535377.1 hypothetical protein [Alkalimonas collagenimarina]